MSTQWYINIFGALFLIGLLFAMKFDYLFSSSQLLFIGCSSMVIGPLIIGLSLFNLTQKKEHLRKRKK